jgi:hypothetical protein
MTVQRHGRPHPDIGRTFTAVRAALPAVCAAAFDAQLEAGVILVRSRIQLSRVLLSGRLVNP